MNLNSLSMNKCLGEIVPMDKPCYFIPKTKLKNLVCAFCQCKFYIPDLALLNGLLKKEVRIPLLLNCGHSVCNKCMKKSNQLTKCSLCKVAVEISSSSKDLFPLNLYVLGLILASHFRPLIDDDDDKDFEFCHKIWMQSRQISKQEFCHECEIQANVKCLQCVALYCYSCYSKIHGKALQNHTQIPIHKGNSNSFFNIVNSCSPKCSESLSYYCNQCNVALCSNCILNLHKLHDFVPLMEKNEALLPEFDQVYEHIEESLLRIGQTREKVKSILQSNMYKLQNTKDLETSITEHFAYLHGFLQNMEAKLLNELHQQCNIVKEDLNDIEMQLQSQEETLKIIMQHASYTRQSFHKVDMQNVIQILKESMDLPCYLMYEDTSQSNKGVFISDDSIIMAIENHCAINMPSMMSYNLVRKDELPKNYIMSPLMKTHDVTITKPSQQVALVSSNKPNNSNNTSTMSIESENEETFKFNVEIVHIVNASLFFVRKIAAKSKFVQFEKDLIEYENNRQVLQPIDIKQNDMCVIKQQIGNKWYRGYVTAVNNAMDGRRIYDVFYVDYGYVENHVSSSRVRNIVKHLRELPLQAIRCCLYGVIPKKSHWTFASTKDFMKLVSLNDEIETNSTISISMIVIKSTFEKLYVDLCIVTVNNNNIGLQSICTAMVDMNHACFKTTSSTIKAIEYETQYKEKILTQEELPLYKSTKVIVQYVASPDKIYIIKVIHSKKLMNMAESLNKYYKENSPKKIDAPQPGMACAVQLIDFWQRAEIIEVMNENKVKVFCVDCGYSLSVTCDKLQAIPLCYTTYKKQAIRISLMHIAPEFDRRLKSEISKVLFNMFSEAEHITVYPQKRIKNRYYGCIFTDNIDVSQRLKYTGVINKYNMCKKANTQEDNKSQSDNLVTNLFSDAKNNASIKKDDITEDLFKVEVLVQQVITPYCIYVAQKEYEKSNAKFILRMQEFYNTYHSLTENNWCKGALCAVYSAKDKAYFRAKILNINSPMEVLVYFYDMGIEETVTLKDIQILHSKFIEQPAYYFKVKLAGILPCGGTSTWPSLSCTTLLDIIQENINCKFYITKLVQEKICDDTIPVELWIRQIRIPGPFLPSIIEINSVNRILVDKGVALPIKNYFSKADSILAIELDLQLMKTRELLPTKEEKLEVKWLKKAFLDVDHKKLNDTVMSNKSDSLSYSNDTASTIDINMKILKYENSLTTINCQLKFSNWLPPIEIMKKVFCAIPTYVDDDCAVYLYPKKYNSHILHYIEAKLQIHCKSIRIKEWKQWNEGDICLARYHLNKKWYRGKILKKLKNTLQVEFVDYGNIEECEIQCVTDDVRLQHIPIQCTKCIISGLKLLNETDKWTSDDLNRIHALLVEQECEVTVLQRQPTQLIISLNLLRPWKCNILLYLVNHMNINIKTEHVKWNEDFKISTNEDLKSNSTTDVTIKELIDDEKINVDNEKSWLELYKQNTLEERVISGNLAVIFKDDKKTCDFEKISLMDAINLEENILDVQASSTPQRQLDEDNFGIYKPLKIPQETKYIELTLSFNKDPVTCYAQLAKNEDDIFLNMFHEYYLQYKTIMEDLQVYASSLPLIQSFEKNTPCIAKFSDDIWYRCIITHSQKISNSLYIQISLLYVDYGNCEYKMLDLLLDHGLHVPKQEWLELPAMAIKCTFWKLKCISSDIDSLTKKLSKIYNQAVVAQIKKINDDNDLVVEIYKDKTFKELLYMHLIEEGEYQSKED